MDDHGAVVTLGEIAPNGIQGGPFGTQLYASDYVPSGVPLIMPKNIGKNVFQLSQMDFVSEADAHRLKVHRVRQGDLVIGRKGDLGRRALVGAEHEGWLCGTDCIRIRPDMSRMLPRFLYYSFALDPVVSFLMGRNSGSTMPNLNTRNLAELPLLVPSLQRQRGVVAVLGALDGKIAVNERIRVTALDLARSHYQDFARAGDTSAVGEVAAVYDGPHATPVKTTEGPWFLSISSLNNGVLDLDESAHLSEDDFARWTRRVTPRIGDVLFSYETRLGSAALMPGDVRACLGRRMALLRPREGEVGSATLLHAYLSEEFQATVARRAIHGATVDRIPLTELPSWPIPLPARDRRDQAESVLGSLHRRIESSQRESRVLAELRDTLLPKLMSGELRIRDAERQVEEAT